MTTALELKQITVACDQGKILDAVSFTLNEGEIGSLLGPSGSGKTTLLRTVAGFEQPVHGEVWIKGVRSSNGEYLVPVEQRNIGMVFQDYALFPHMTVRENISFGLTGMTKFQQQERTAELVELLGLEKGMMDNYPHRLSGGQQQRVALARAMAPRPGILLLDEPFASLDIELREQLAGEVRTILKKDGITAILVSHNQLEAFAMADIIGVMREGRLLQWDNAYNLYHKPNCFHVADFIGEGIFIPGTVINEFEVKTEIGMIAGHCPHGLVSGAAVDILIRPDDIQHDDSSEMTAIVLGKAFRGAQFLYTLELESKTRVLSLVPSHHNHPLDESIGIRLEADHLVAFPR
ncbi:MAG: ABC transporter ATP-binding protein [Gammaproteobacteria bacterium RBG_16_51_14]|nr:MAG: ABC transporter ATP-binding protein [Gammaproteobacteria bacterium RBG_16_51_14]